MQLRVLGEKGFHKFASKYVRVYFQQRSVCRQPHYLMRKNPLTKTSGRPFERGFLLSTCCQALQPGQQVKDVQKQYQLVRIAGDGRCLFRALSLGACMLTKTDQSARMSFQEHTEMADALRLQVCNELYKRKDDIMPFLDEDFDKYVIKMKQPSCWGGEPELAVAIHAIKHPVFVYSSQGGTNMVLVSKYGEDEYPEKPAIRLLYHRPGHYDLLVQAPITAKM